ncbi:MAG: MogA/MoaB family molybdenum cofactor biosynthesis protein [Acidimicrobiia bacterium]|nr:MogA/MoaB family molybdenum cofactor biosynthesis protein [Acidimicrobiia bacterium]
MAAMKAGVLTVSDRVTRGEAEDVSGPTAIAMLAGLGFDVDWHVVPDEAPKITAALEQWIRDDFDLIVTTGGTGFSPRDITPEVTRELIDRPAPGLVEAARAASKHPLSMLSRGIAGIAASTLIINLPGSTNGVEETLDVMRPALVHAVSLLRDEPTPHPPASR